MEGGCWKMIDNKIVKMEFDNKQFEQNVQQTIKTLDDLDKGLKLDNAVKGLSNLDAYIKKFSLDAIAASLENISSKFSNMSIIGITALQNLTNSVVDQGKKMAAALTIDPIKTGLSEYETKMNAIKTILSNTKANGTTLDDVNKALAQLNEYSDNTVYNFAQMSDMVGKFAAKSGELDTSVSIVQGLANLAAEAGVDNTRLQGALYQVSQMSETVKSLDWSSMDTAGLATVKFKNDLIAMAKSMGTIDTKTLEELESGVVSFRDTLKNDWLTKGVFSAVTEMYALDEAMTASAGEVTTFTKLMIVLAETMQSGWAVSWEKIIGNKDQSTKMFTSIKDGFSALVKPSMDARNNALEFWNTMGGRQAIIDSLKNAFTSLQNIIEPITSAFKNIFPPLTGQKLVDISKGILKLTEMFRVTEADADKLRNIFGGLFSILGIGAQVVTSIWKAFTGLFSSFSGIDLGILDFLQNIAFFFIGLNLYLKESDAFTKAITTIFNTFKNFFGFIGGMAVYAYNAISSILKSFDGFGTVDLSGMTEFKDKALTALAPIASIGGKLEASFDKGVTSVGNFAKFIGNIGKKIGLAFSTIKNAIGNSFDGLDMGPLKEIFNAGIISGFMIILVKLTAVFTKFLTKGPDFLKSITAVLDGVKESLDAYQQQLKAGTLIKIASAIGLLTLSLVVLSLLNAEKLGAGLTIMGLLFLELFGAAGIFTKISKDGSLSNIGSITLTLLALSISMVILTKAAANLASLDVDKIGETTRAVGSLMIAMSVSAILISRVEDNIIKASIGLIAFAYAMAKIINVVQDLGTTPLDELAKGIIGVGIIIGGLLLFLRFGKVDKFGVSGGLGMTALAKGILILAGAVAIFGVMDLTVMGKGLLGVGILLGALGGFAYLASKNNSMITTGIGVAILAKALLLFNDVITQFATIPFKTLISGLFGMGSALVVIGLGMRVMPADLLLKAVGLIVLAKALQMLSGTLQTLGTMDVEVIKQGLLVLTALFGGLIIVGFALGPVLPVLLGATVLIAGLSLSMMAAGIGAAAFAAGLLSLATIGTVGIAAISAVILTIIDLIPLAMQSFATGIIEFVRIMGEGIPVFMKVAEALILGFATVISTTTPQVLDKMLDMLLKLLVIINEKQGALIDAAISIMLGFLTGLASKTEAVTIAGISVILAFIDGIAAKLPAIIDSAVNLMIQFIEGLAATLELRGPDLIAAFMHLFESIFHLIVDAFSFFGIDLEEVGTKIMEGLVYLFTDFIPDVKQAFVDLVWSALDAIAGFADDFNEAGTNVVKGFLKGITGGMKDVTDGVKNVGKGALTAMKEVLDINSPSEMFAWIGEMVDKGMANGVKKFSYLPADESADMGNHVLDNIDALKMEAAGNKSGEAVGTGLADGINSSKSTAIKAADDVGKSLFDKTSEWINEMKYYNKLNLQQELAEWNKLGNNPSLTAEDRIKLAKEQYRLSNEIDDAKFKHSKDWIDERLYYGELSLVEELEAWQRIQGRYAKGTEKRKEADREVYRLKKDIIAKQEELDNEYYENTKKINEQLIADVEAVTAEYENAVTSRADALYSSYGLFDKVEEKMNANGSVLTDNLRDQVSELKDWKASIASLKSKGIDDALLTELTDMGPKAISEIKALNNMTDGQLWIYVELWKSKHEEARSQAEIELVGMRTDMEAQIQAYNDSTAEELAITTEIWETELRNLNKVVSTNFDTMSKESVDTIKAMGVNIDKEVKIITDKTKVAFESAGWDTTGSNMILGIISGMKLRTEELIKTSASIAKSALFAANKALGCKSPSKEFEKLGMNADLGFINGLNAYSGQVSAQSTDVGVQAVSALSKALTTVGQFISGDMELNPTITPVLDLTNVQNGSKALQTMLNGTTVPLNASASINASMAARAQGITEQQQATTITNNRTPITISVVNQVRSDADITKVNSGLDNLINKYNNAKGVFAQ